MMQRVFILVAIVVLAIFNAMFSPHTVLVFALQGIWYPPFLPAPLTFMLVLSGIISAVLHLLVTGIPVGLFDRFFPEQKTASALLWLGLMLMATILTLQNKGWL